MSRPATTNEENAMKNATVSRAEAERLVVLHVIEGGRRSTGAITAGLGLPQSLASAVGEVATALHEEGLLTEDGGDYHLSESGQGLLQRRLGDLGLG